MTIFYLNLLFSLHLSHIFQANTLSILLSTENSRGIISRFAFKISLSNSPIILFHIKYVLLQKLGDSSEGPMEKKVEYSKYLRFNEDFEV